MQEQIQSTHTIGTLLQQRYLVEDLLGRGGFGAVYLVKDQQADGALVALKELRDQDASEKKRLLFECELLKRLDHPALPQFKGLFEENHRLYMLMEYIQGQNLEILRKQRQENTFSFSEMLALVQPISEAAAYLHQQHPPLLHRDIKPANIVVSEHGERIVLVDFGIAKEYHADATTTAIRRCSPGYSAPEQYSSMGTDPRVDIYELGATCYTLLTGTPPVDALQRLTKLASKGVDPLVAVDELAPAIPSTAAEAIQMALALNYEQRFATVEEFWQALTAAPDDNRTTRVRTTGKISQRTVKVSAPLRPARQSAHSRRRRVALVILLAFLTVSLTLGLWFRFPQISASYASGFSPTATGHTTPTHIPGGDYPILATTYAGTLDNLLTHTTITIAFVTVSQNGQTIRGAFIEQHVSQKRAFSGVVDTAGHMLVTVVGGADLSALFFQGIVHTDKTLAGNYCSVDAAGQCSGSEYGLWSLAPSA